MSEHPLVQPASTQYSDWKGTAAAEPPQGVGPDLYELLGVDQEAGHIVGVEIYWEGYGAHVVAYIAPSGESSVDPGDGSRGVLKHFVDLGYMEGDEGPALNDVLRTFDRFCVVVTSGGSDLRVIGEWPSSQAKDDDG